MGRGRGCSGAGACGGVCGCYPRCWCWCWCSCAGRVARELALADAVGGSAGGGIWGLMACRLCQRSKGFLGAEVGVRKEVQEILCLLLPLYPFGNGEEEREGGYE
jgi:hypothetical protein